MILDSRIKAGKKPLTCFDTEEASKFVDKKGYFSDCLYNFQNLDNCSKSILHCIDDKRENSNDYIFNDGKYYCRFFLPEAYVIPEEPKKKYRPYTLAEWIDQHEIGDVIHYRSKSGEIELRQMYVGTRHSQGIKNIIVKITLGNESHTFDYLFEDYEIEVDGEWLPFGIEVEE